MRLCNRDDADVIVDGKPYRFDTAKAYDDFGRRKYLKGIEMLDIENTRRCLKSEHEARLRLFREERAGK